VNTRSGVRCSVAASLLGATGVRDAMLAPVRDQLIEQRRGQPDHIAAAAASVAQLAIDGSGEHLDPAEGDAVRR